MAFKGNSYAPYIEFPESGPGQLEEKVTFNNSL